MSGDHLETKTTRCRGVLGSGLLCLTTSGCGFVLLQFLAEEFVGGNSWCQVDVFVGVEF